MAEFCAMRYRPPSPPQRAHPPMSQRTGGRAHLDMSQHGVSRNLRPCRTKRMFYGGGPDLLKHDFAGALPGPRQSRG